MDSLPFQPLIDGDFGALGEQFRPAPAEVERRAADRLVSPSEDFPQLLADPTYSWTIATEIPVPLIVYMVSSSGRRLATAKLSGGTPGKPRTHPITVPDAAPYTYVVAEATTGAFVTGFNAASGDTKTISPTTLRPVNNPGLPDAPGELPSPTRSGSPLPSDSPPVLVGSGIITDSNDKPVAVIARLQHWQRSTDSYSLPGCARLSITLTQSTGVTRSSSTRDSISTAIGSSASLGWGPISASISASMSQSSTTTQDVSVSDSSEATLVRELRNPYTTPMVALLWQLVDQVVILEPTSYELKAMIESVVEPAIPRIYDSEGGVYPPKNPTTCVQRGEIE